VLAQFGDQYGFYRGTQPLGQTPTEKVGKALEQQAPTQARVQLGDVVQQVERYDALSNNSDRLRKLQEQQLQRWNIQTDGSNVKLRSQKAATLY
jgi:hypothetical protein